MKTAILTEKLIDLIKAGTFTPDEILAMSGEEIMKALAIPVKTIPHTKPDGSVVQIKQVPSGVAVGRIRKIIRNKKRQAVLRVEAKSALAALGVEATKFTSIPAKRLEIAKDKHGDKYVRIWINGRPGRAAARLRAKEQAIADGVYDETDPIWQENE